MPDEVTTFDSLTEYAKGTLMTLPEFGPGQPFVAYVRRPSLLALAASGRIPNQLLGMANKLFKKSGGAIEDAKPETLQHATKVFQILAEAALVKPTYSEIKEAGLELTDDQLVVIFNYTQRGVKALETFREQPKNYKRPGGGAKVRQAPVGDSGDKG